MEPPTSTSTEMAAEEKEEEPGLFKRLSKAVSGAKEAKKEEYQKWPSDHPYAYTIGDVEYREVPDIKTGKMKKMLFGLNSWPASSLKPKKNISENKEEEK